MARHTLHLYTLWGVTPETSDVGAGAKAEVEVEVLEEVVFWWKQKRKQNQKRLKICCIRFHSVLKLLLGF
jgi:hypothetical protein